MTKVPDHIARMIRVDQAGEFGATRIYAGQLAVMGDRGPHSAEIAGMAEQEAGHRAKFDALCGFTGFQPFDTLCTERCVLQALGPATGWVTTLAWAACLEGVGMGWKIRG